MANEEIVFSPDSTRVRLTLTNIITMVGIVSAAVVAWQKIPSSEDVKSITTESIRQAMASANEANLKNDELERKRVERLEHQYAAVNEELAKMNQRMDYLLILIAGSTAEDIRRSPRARSAADRVKRNLQTGADPLEGLSWSPE